MPNVATIIAGENFKINIDVANEIASDLEHNAAYIENIEELSSNKAYDIYFNNLHLDEARNLLENLLEGEDVDFTVQSDEGRKKKLLISDMDSTIINEECLDEIAGELGIKEKIAEITERAMNGEIDFKAALRERVALLKGLDAAKLENVYKEKITFTEGAKELVQTMKQNGAFCVLVSGGFTFFTKRVAEHCGFDIEEANILKIDSEGKLTGKVKEPILDSAAKVNALNHFCQEERVNLRDTLAIGDGANDLPMILESSTQGGLGIAFTAKPFVQAKAKHKINIRNLRYALYVQGYKDSDIVEN